MKICKYCAQTSPDDAVYCSNCGLKLSDKCVCPNCMHEVSANDEVCEYCNHPLKSTPGACPHCKFEIDEEAEVCPYCGHVLQ